MPFKISFVEVFRGCAALMVVLDHALHALSVPDGPISIAQTGVALFFLISGTDDGGKRIIALHLHDRERLLRFLALPAEIGSGALRDVLAYRE